MPYTHFRRNHEILPALIRIHTIIKIHVSLEDGRKNYVEHRVLNRFKAESGLVLGVARRWFGGIDGIERHRNISVLRQQ